MTDNIRKEVIDLMEKSVNLLNAKFNKVRTGRASLTLLDGIRVNYNGVPMPINQLATLSIPEPRMIVIRPWDNKNNDIIEKAILKSEIGITPQKESKVIRIFIPQLTEERRKELVKIIKRIAEEIKVSIRNIRRDINDKLKDFLKKNDLDKDSFHLKQNDIQKITDNYILKVNKLLFEKEKDIMKF